MLLMAALLIADELWDTRAALAKKGASGESAQEPAPEPARELTREAAAERREQEAIRAEHRRRAAAPVEG